MFTLAHAGLCPGNAEEEESRVGEGSLCLWRGPRSSDFPPTADKGWCDCNICSQTGASVASFHSQIGQNAARLAKLEVKLAWFCTDIGQKDNNSIRNAGTMRLI